jgi:hypothetical protein
LVEIQDEATREQWYLPYAAISSVQQQHVYELVLPTSARPAVNFPPRDTVGFTDTYLPEHVSAVQRVNAKALSIGCGGVLWCVVAAAETNH